MDWNILLSTKRLGMETWKPSARQEDRSQFQRDYDRIIFSSPFRRMQNKTQVFPLPEHIFVHNRLTHSLEVASVGRSLGNLLAEKLTEQFPENKLIPEIGTIVSAACLAHDLGNPPFGHSGESAISGFFQNGAGKEFKDKLSAAEWTDFIRFDGNANAFRILSHQFNGKRPGGFALTYPTLASIVKYPFESPLATRQKCGFFQTEKETFLQIAGELQLPSKVQEHLSFERHPLVYLVEAADDICYQIMDLEDACKLGILSYEKVTELFLGFYDRKHDQKALKSIENTLKRVTDRNEQISYLRAGVIGKLIHESMHVFDSNYDRILNGSFDKSLIGSLENWHAQAMNMVKEVSASEVYAHRSVVEIEIAGFKIIGTLLEEFVGAVMDPNERYNKKILSLLPEQYRPQSESIYNKIQSAVDFVSGMTDVFALDLYRKIKGISLPGVV
ncbi:deoxyguanosinetriphosphate triphosphohydrolase [Mariniphaga sediminis]|jgi:dGTPase|uniref:Deoxyguanosinetriphosphate triphosphohydrolase n=1 Tax=Mariniphaga sediminis TaxID=1628158 RepID=A0A399D583_9BACT|nr:deoxyguanosinetriphosphate triphosphohydrolase [Mariniphaga sediminis]RIH65590.1 deoxyguanosinetriphosphate triphosphohydrolase [Mariniphaga sediminis]